MIWYIERCVGALGQQKGITGRSMVSECGDKRPRYGELPEGRRVDPYRFARRIYVNVPAYVVQDIFPADYEFREFRIRSGHSQAIVSVDKSVGQTHHIDVGVAEKFLRKGQ